jgi:hypothetical protein
MEVAPVDDKNRVFQAIVWKLGSGSTGERTTVLATDLDDAERQLKARYGGDIVFSLFNEDDAGQAR